jgi:hypothetical protein
MVTAMYACAKVLGVISEEPYCLRIASSVIPGYESYFNKKVVLLHFLQELFVIKTAVPGSKKWIVNDEAG